MMNIFSINNLDQIEFDYKLYKVRGLSYESDSFEKNFQLLCDRLSRMTSSPCFALSENGSLYIAQPEGHKQIPERVPLVGTEALVEPTGLKRHLNLGKLDKKNADLAIRFLQFHLNNLLQQNNSLWRPSAGLPFFQKDPDPNFGSHDIVMHKGFKVRLNLFSNYRIGLCIDVTCKYASRHYLSPIIATDDFRKIKNKRCIYEFGNRWYEVNINGMSDLNISEERVENCSLYEYIQNKVKFNKPKALQELSKTCTVLTYKTKLGQTKRIPSALCRLTYDTQHPIIKKRHYKTIISPLERKEEIEFVLRRYLNDWYLNGIHIELSKNNKHT